VGLHVEHHGRVALLTLDDAARRNALSAEMVEAIVDAVDRVERDESVGAVVVTGAAPAFCSGADTSSLRAMGEGHADGESVRPIYDGFLRVRDCRLPTVAAVNGPAVGAGFNLALCCDVRLAAVSARFDSRFASIGLHPGGGHTWMLDRAVGPESAAAMALFGQRVDGRRAVELGLAWACVDDTALVETALAFAAHAAELPRELLASVKASLREVPGLDFDDAVILELERQAASMRQGWVAARLAARR
jgi:enoyl-CoA hydratase